MHLGRYLIRWYAQDWGIKVATCPFKRGHVIPLRQFNITVRIFTIYVHKDTQVCRVSFLFVMEEAHAEDLVTLWREIKVIDAVSDYLSSEINHILLLVLLLIGNLVDLEVQLALVDSNEFGLVITASNWVDTLFGVFTIKATREDHVGTHQVINNSPDLAHIRADTDEELAILRVG